MKIYLIGIKGAGMSSLAQILLDEGYEVRGSDTTNFINTEVSLKLRNVIIDPLDSKEYLNSDIVIIGHYFYKNELIDELNKMDRISKFLEVYHGPSRPEYFYRSRRAGQLHPCRGKAGLFPAHHLLSD